MNIDVKLFSRFREHLPAEARGEATLRLPDGTTIAGLLDHLGISARVQLVSVNDQPEPDRDRVLHDGDSVRIFPFVVGG
ncbi:MAG TPA: MoaD/ThiS family protein [Anaerolineae bacterium]|jgi:sulfur carrier protein ThiS|nr:MoaD/ThiS family protein [Anaerolineae bacterium]